MGLWGDLVGCDVEDVVWWRSWFGNVMSVWRVWRVVLKLLVCVCVCVCVLGGLLESGLGFSVFLWGLELGL